MTIRNLDAFFDARRIALIGASPREGALGNALLHNMLAGGFQGAIYPVNPRHDAAGGIKAYRSISDLPDPPDLGIIVTPPKTVPGLIDELGRAGARAAVVITAGFGEGGDEEGKALRQAVLDASKPHLLRVIGPNCIGLLGPHTGLNASFAHVCPAAGDVAFLSQSGAVVTTVLDWASAHGIGFSHIVSVGDMLDVDFGDLLDYMVADPNTKTILMYVEAITNPRKFMSAARSASRIKPVIVVKSGRHAASAQAASSHTGALAGSDAVYEAAFARAGMLRVLTLESLFETAELVAKAKPVSSDRLCILTNGGGLGVLAADEVIEQGGQLAPLAPSTMERLNACLPPTWSHGNPIDIIGDAGQQRYRDALECVSADPDIDALLVLYCPTQLTNADDIAQALIESGVSKKKLTLAAWLGNDAVAAGRKRLTQSGLPTYEYAEDAVKAFMTMVRFRKHQEMLMEVPPTGPIRETAGLAAFEDQFETALVEDRTWLSLAECRGLFEAYGIATNPSQLVHTPEDAAKTAADIGQPVALKIVSPDIPHKTDVGGVALNITNPENVRLIAQQILSQVKDAAPSARIVGLAVEPMVPPRTGHELIAGITSDATFGPIVLFGHGGTATEVIDDKALGLVPLNMNLARSMIRQTRVSRLLRGARGQVDTDTDAVARTLVSLSQMVIDLPMIQEIDINPMIAGADGVMALDCKVRIGEVTSRSDERFVIRPYPKTLETTATLRDGSTIGLRPIRPEDEPALHEAFAHLTQEDIHFRFFMSLAELSHPMAAQLTQIDYDRQMALVALENGLATDAAILGIARIHADPDNIRAEFAISTRSDKKGLGIGTALMTHLLDYARERGLHEVWGDVLQDNSTMLQFVDRLGFIRTPSTDDPSVVRVSKGLREDSPADEVPLERAS